MKDKPLYHTLSGEELFRLFQTSHNGLSRAQVQERLSRFGKNTLKEETISKAAIFFRQFKSILIYILIAASLVSLSIGEWIDFLVIIWIIIVNGLIGFWQEIKAEASLSALKKLTESSSKAIRGGELNLVASSELVPGDYLIFHEGEIVTADVRLVESAGLMSDEAALTGESAPVIKSHESAVDEKALPNQWANMLLAGTTLVRGTGRGVVVATGESTYLASIAQRVQEKSPETPLTQTLRFFTKRYILGVIGLLIFLGLVGFAQGRSFLQLVYMLLASLVSAVPEGLPIVITLVMVIGAIALSKKKALIRYLPSVETLGSATVIASDKTGTITEGKLIVKEAFAHDLDKMRHIAALCNDAHQGSGDPLDVALSDWIDDFDEIRRLYPRKWGYSFDSRLMLMGTLHQVGEGEEILIKGAYESLKEKAVNQNDLEVHFQNFIKKGMRVLAFGFAQSREKDPSLWKIKLVGLIGFLDPPKLGVLEAVRAAQNAGVRVVMITGDHPMTAQAIAKEVGIWREGCHVLTGRDIELFSDEELQTAVRKTAVFARILPEHKYRIVKLLQKSGEIVAVTGDGVNDVPALRAADIGIAMGSGTEAAKTASKMVIADSNLSVIIDAIKNARVIADNIRKVIYYLISTSIQVLMLIAFSIFSGLQLPLAAIQILWINLVADGVQDKTFPFAKAESDVMSRHPRKPHAQFFDLAQIGRVFFFGVTTAIFCFYLYIYLVDKLDFKEVSTVVFTAIAAAQWANGIQSQKEKEPFFKNLKKSFSINPFIFVGMGVGVLLQCLAVYGMPEIFHCTPMSWSEWIYPALVFIATFGIVELRKWGERALTTTFPR